MGGRTYSVTPVDWRPSRKTSLTEMFASAEGANCALRYDLMVAELLKKAFRLPGLTFKS